MGAAEPGSFREAGVAGGARPAWRAGSGAGATGARRAGRGAGPTGAAAAAYAGGTPSFSRSEFPRFQRSTNTEAVVTRRRRR
jgi:hypothetical protein